MIHPESFAINYIKFNFSSPPNPHLSFFSHQDFSLATTNLFFHLLCPLIFTCFLITLLVNLVQCQHFSSFMSHCTSRRIRPPCCLANTFRLLQPLWLLPSFSTLLCITLSQLSFSKQFLVFLSPFNLQESFGKQHVLSS